MWELLNTKSYFTHAIFMLPAFVSFFGAASLFFLAEKTRSKRNLQRLLWMFCICSIFCLLYDFILNDPPYPIYGFGNVFTIIGTSPLMFIYIDGITQPDKKRWRKDIPWFVLAIVLALIELILALTDNIFPEKYSWKEFREILWNPDPFIRFFGFYIGAGEFIFFLIRSSIIVYRYRKKLADSHSYTEKISLTWVYYFLGIMFLVGVGMVFYAANSELFYKVAYAIIFFIMMFILYILGSWQQEVPYIENPEIIKPGAESLVPHSVQLMKKIDIYFEENRPFLNPQLTLNDIATALQSNRTYVSRAINNEKKVNFYQYVNSYRIQHTIELLQSPEGKKYTMDAVAERAGFNSLTTFYHFFKQEKGCTPKQYIKE